MKVAARVSASESGYSMVVLLASLAIMMILMAAAVPTWRYVIKNDREEELIFRGGEIADAIARFQQKNGNALPPSLEVLVKGKFLRHAYKDPMTRDGRWRFIRPGEVIGADASLFGSRGGSATVTTTTTTTTTTRPSAFSPTTQVMGGFQGVVSTSTDKALRLFNGRSKYSEWVFIPGQPRVIGKPIGLPMGQMTPFGGGFGGRGGGMPRPGGGMPRPGGAPGMVNPQAPPYVVPP